MALFSRYKPPANATFSPAGMSGPDKMMVLGAMLRDLGSGNGPETLLGTQQFIAGRQLQQQKLDAQRGLANLFQPTSSAPISAIGDFQGSTPEALAPRPRSLRDMAPQLAKAAAAGIDISDYVTLADKITPRVEVANGVAYDPTQTAPGQRVGVNLQNVNGFQVDPNDPANTGRYLPKVADGAVPLFDQSGNVVAQRLLDGTVQAIEAQEGARARAQEGARADLDLVAVPRADGSSVMMPRSMAVQALGGGGVGGGLGVSQSPGQRVYSENTARTQAEREAVQPKAFSGLEAQSRTTDLVINSIDKALTQIGPWSAGLGANLGIIKGTPAHDLQSTLDTIRANVGFDQLQQMRDNSPTGGALGQVSEQENRLLQSVLGALEQGQSPEQLSANLLQVRNQLDLIRQQRQRLFDETYGRRPAQGSPAQGRPSRAEVEAELRKRGLL